MPRGLTHHRCYRSYIGACHHPDFEERACKLDCLRRRRPARCIVATDRSLSVPLPFTLIRLLITPTYSGFLLDFSCKMALLGRRSSVCGPWHGCKNDPEGRLGGRGCGKCGEGPE